MFSVYKSNLKRFQRQFEADEWYELHLRAIREINEDTALMEFRHCGIPKTDEILTVDEMIDIFFELLEDY